MERWRLEKKKDIWDRLFSRLIGEDNKKIISAGFGRRRRWKKWRIWSQQDKWTAVVVPSVNPIPAPRSYASCDFFVSFLNF